MNTIETQDILFELGTEELPPTNLLQLSSSLQFAFEKGLKDAGLSYKKITPFVTPRRLALVIEACQINQPDKEVERKGPAVKAAFDKQNNPTKAAMGFATSCGTTVEQLTRQKTNKGEWLLFKQIHKGEPTAKLLPGIAEKALYQLPIAKRMRWGAEEFQFVRPVHWLVFMLGETIVPCQIMGVEASRYSYGHRFHHPEPIWITTPAEYQSTLQKVGKVIASFDKRRKFIRKHLILAAEKLHCNAEIESHLLDEVTGLVEWPMVVAGSFDKKYLEIPHEALIYTMKTNQKYFHLYNQENKLKNVFLTVANIQTEETTVIRQGNERVIRPRLEDAMFFWQQDAKVTLESYLERLKTVVFQNKLGSMFDKTQRVRHLAGYIAEFIGADLKITDRVALLSRCDLMTEMVNEFAAMQGIMGFYQAQRDGEDDIVAKALPELYLPKFAGDLLPETKEGIALSLAEKIDTLVGIFGIDLKPTGDKDPFALRRATIGALRILNEKNLSLNLFNLLDIAKKGYSDELTNQNVLNDVYDFMISRLKVMYTVEGKNPKIIDSVSILNPLTIPDFNQRIMAVDHFITLDESTILSAANKRIQNILNKSGEDLKAPVNEDLFKEMAEIQLYDQIQLVDDIIQPLMNKGDYQKVLTTLATLHEPVDLFFDEVMVMDKDPQIKCNRLALLAELKILLTQVADISLLQGL